MVEEIIPFSKDKVKRDIQAMFERDFPHFAPLSIRLDLCEPVEDSKFFICFEVIAHDDIRAKFIGDIWYGEDGQLNPFDLIPL